MWVWISVIKYVIAWDKIPTVDGWLEYRYEKSGNPQHVRALLVAN